MIYIIIFLYTIFSALLFRKNLQCNVNVQHKTGKINIGFAKRNLTAFVVMLPATMVLALRYGFGADYHGTYRNVFNAVLYNWDTYLKNAKVESGFILICHIVKNFTHDYVWLLFISAIITMYILTKAILENSENYVISILFVFITAMYFDMTNLVRQCIALSIFMYAIKYINKREIKKYILCIIIAMMFHISILFLMPVYFLYDFNVKNSYKILIPVITLFFSTFIGKILTYILLKIPKYAPYARKINVGSTDIILVLLFCIVYLLALFYSANSKGIEDFYVNMLMVAVTIGLASLSIPFLHRFLIYFKLLFIFYNPILFKNLTNKKWGFLIKIFVIVLFVLYTVYVVYIGDWYGANPYRNIFSR